MKYIFNIIIFTLSNYLLGCSVLSKSAHTKCNCTTFISCKSYTFFDPFENKDVEEWTLGSTEFDDIKEIIRTEYRLTEKKGTVDYYIRDTLLLLHCEITNCKINGKCVSYFSPPKGDTFKVGNFKNNKLHGDYKQYHPDGSLIFHRQYKNGKLICSY